MYKELIDQTKRQFLYFIAFRFYLRNRVQIQSYSDLLSNSHECMVILPENQGDFDNALEAAKTLSLNKMVTLLLKDNQVSYVKARTHLPYISVDELSLNKIKLPSREFSDTLRNRRFDIVIDLNIAENISYSVICYLTNAKYKIGFKKKNSEKFYNLIIVNNEINSAFSYRNLLNSLQMF